MSTLTSPFRPLRTPRETESGHADVRTLSLEPSIPQSDAVFLGRRRQHTRPAPCLSATTERAARGGQSGAARTTRQRRSQASTNPVVSSRVVWSLNRESVRGTLQAEELDDLTLR